MLRAPMLNRSRGRGLQKSNTRSVPAPVGGWNVMDPLAAMPPQDAVVLENWFPTASTVELRPGCVEWSTGYPTAPLSLHTWNGPTGSKMFAATATGIYNATANTAIGAAVSAVTSGYLQSVNFQVAGGQYLVLVNGQDKLKLYNGTTWQDIDNASVPAITGLATTSLSNVGVSCRRLWFVQKNSMSAWYLPTAAIAGALTEFPLGSVFTRGGYLVAMNTWTVDGGDGSDDYTVFMSSEGEAAVYKGTDPSSLTTFSKVGVYYIGEPIGLNCLVKYGGDLLILCRNGLFPLSRAMQSAVVNRAASLTKKIDTAFSTATGLYGGNPGWSVLVYPQGSFLLVNIPTNATYCIQYVMNTITGAWCVFKGWQANAWTSLNNEIYFASNTLVAKAWTGRSDFGANIVGNAQGAFNAFGAPARQKHFKLCRPLLQLDGSLELKFCLATDYADATSPSIVVSNASASSVWNSSAWNSAVWGGSAELHREWRTVFARECYVAAFCLQVASASVTVRWSATDFVFELGGVL